MVKYIYKRLLLMVLVLVGVGLLTFTMMYFSPGRPEDFILGDLATKDEKAVFRQQNGLDDPFAVQFVRYMAGALHGDLGTSYATKLPVMQQLIPRFLTTLKLTVYGMIFATVVGVIIGIISAVKQYSALDNITQVIAMLGVSMPSFWEGIMLIILFSVILKWLPPSGVENPSGWILPSITLGTWALCSVMRIARSSMLEEIRQDYVVTAKAIGQSEFAVIMKHVLKNALLPIVTVVGINFSRLLGGAAVIEIVFSVPGIGKLIVDAIQTKDAPIVQGGILYIAFFMILVNLLVDVLYAFIDPRIRSQFVSKKPSRNIQKREGATNA